MDQFVQGVPCEAAGVAKLGGGGQQGVADGHDGGRGNRMLKPLSPLVAPARDRSAWRSSAMVTAARKKSRHESDLGLEAGAPAVADGCA
jgi:hypothetical protein